MTTTILIIAENDAKSTMSLQLATEADWIPSNPQDATVRRISGFKPKMIRRVLLYGFGYELLYVPHRPSEEVLDATRQIIFKAADTGQFYPHGVAERLAAAGLLAHISKPENAQGA